MTDHKCENCAHWGDGNAFSAYGMDFCCREDSGHYNDLMNSDSYTYNDATGSVRK